MGRHMVKVQNFEEMDETKVKVNYERCPRCGKFGQPGGLHVCWDCWYKMPYAEQLKVQSLYPAWESRVRGRRAA